MVSVSFRPDWARGILSALVGTVVPINLACSNSTDRSDPGLVDSRAGESAEVAGNAGGSAPVASDDEGIPTRTGSPAPGGGANSTSAGGGSGASPVGAGGSTRATGGATSNMGGAAIGGSANTTPLGPTIDRSQPQLYQFEFTAEEADPAADLALGQQNALLDTRVESAGKLVIYLHGAGDFANCGDLPLAPLVAGQGFHWFAPCYSSNYGVENCGDDIAGCRLEAFEGTDHHAFLDIARPNGIEERLVQGLNHLQGLNPEGDWLYFLDGNAPRWSEIVISGHSHGASSSGIIGVNRSVFGVVMLAGPFDPGQAWLSQVPITPRERFFGFTHSGDTQHQGHLDALALLGVPGDAALIDTADPPYGGSQRLFTNAAVADPHGSVTSGDIESFLPAWQYLYGGGSAP